MAYFKSNEMDTNRHMTEVKEIWIMHYKNEKKKAARTDEGAFA